LRLTCLVWELDLVYTIEHLVLTERPGYGNSTARKVAEDYAQEEINIGMLAMLKDTGRDKAVWIGM
jgi:soluble epoxide hydrolase/lipid-phosphate phosphatase